MINIIPIFVSYYGDDKFEPAIRVRINIKLILVRINIKLILTLIGCYNREKNKRLK